jgi:hypothetical protein
MKDLLLKALDEAVNDFVLKEYNSLVAGLIEEKGSQETGPNGGALALGRFRSGIAYAIEAYNEARLAIGEMAA